MVSKTFIAATLLAAGASAAPAITAREETAQRFGALAARSASPIHYAPLNAAGQQIWLYGNPTTYCPSPPVTDCPAGNTTAFSYYGGSLSMDVVVPGGQRVYVAANGAVGFTQAHSASIPKGAKTEGFSLKDTGRGYSLLSFGDGFIACPAKAGDNASPWKVFAVQGGSPKDRDVPSGKKADCLGFSVLAGSYDGPTAAWQYI